MKLSSKKVEVGTKKINCEYTQEMLNDLEKLSSMEDGIKRINREDKLKSLLDDYDNNWYPDQQL